MAVVAVGSCATSRRSLLTACEPVFSEHRVESCTLAMSIFWVGMSQEKVFHVDSASESQQNGYGMQRQHLSNVALRDR